MSELAFTNLLAITAIAFAAPLLLGLVPALRLPAVVLEIVAGIVVGPAVLDWVHVDQPVEVLALVGLAFLLFLAGLEVEFDRLRGKLLQLALVGFVISFAIGIAAGLGLQAAGFVKDPVFVAIVLSATSLGVVVPVLKDAGLAASPFGQLVIAAASIADVATILLLSLLFSQEGDGLTAQLMLLGGLVVLAAAVAASILLADHSRRLRETLVRLQDTTAQIRVRGAFLLLLVFVAVAQKLGLEVILGAFIAGAMLSALDPDREMTHPQLRLKLEASGFGIFIPVFFVTSGLRFDLDALTSSASTVARVPVFLLALLLVRGLPALAYRRYLASDRQMIVAGLLQATSLPFIVASTAIGLSLDLLTAATAAGLIAAGLLSVLVFPLLSLTLLGPARD